MDFEYYILLLAIFTAWGVPIMSFFYTAHVTDLFRICYERFKKSRTKVSKLKNLVSSQHKGVLNIFLVSMKMILKLAWINLLQRMNSTIAQEGKYYIISHTIRGKLYRIMILPERGPPNILSVIDENYNDVTDEITPYFRATQNVVKDFTPSALGRETLEFSTSDADVYTFSKNEVIKIGK